MREIERFGVLVDICPSCKGVWLDRGELEKILHYATSGYQDEVSPAYDPYAPIAYEPSPYQQPPIQSSPTPTPPPRPAPPPSHPPQQTYSPPPSQQQPPYPSKPPKRKRRFSEFLEELFDIFD